VPWRHCRPNPGGRVTLPRAVTSIVVQQSGEDIFLLDTEGGEMFEVNPSAARIFTFCQRGATYDVVVKALAEEAKAQGQEDVILRDVQSAVRQFQELGLCEP